jgi:hypothetical protein
MVADRRKICYKVKHIFSRDEPIPEYIKKSKKKELLENNKALQAVKNLFKGGLKKAFFHVDSYFMRRQ